MNTGALLRLRRRLVKQAQRSLTVYVFCCGIVVLLLSQLGSGGAPQIPEAAELVKRAPSSSSKSSASSLGAFPRKIWQSWKVDPFDFEERHLFCARSWVSRNSEYRYEVLTDGNALQYVTTHFGPGGLNRPDIVEVYDSLTAKIIKADLLRYLVMYVEGGVYVDVDVEALKPIDRFIPHTSRFQEQDIDMIIGIEIDQPQFANHSILGPKSQSFCQWTFVCKPKLRVMLNLIDNIIHWLQRTANEQNVPISEINLDFDDVISGTGPSAFTEALLAEMSLQEKKPITWDYFHDLVEARVVGRVLVLTVEAFAAGQGHSDSGTHNSKNALVKHHYHASGWPTLHPRYKHPVYGEVEACNWDPLCVAIWDANKAAFDALPPEEQLQQIEEQLALEEMEQEQEEVIDQPDQLVNQLQRRGLDLGSPPASASSVVVKPTVTLTMSHHKQLRPSLTVGAQVASHPNSSPSAMTATPISQPSIMPHAQSTRKASIPTVQPSFTPASRSIISAASALPSKAVSHPSILPSVSITKHASKSVVSLTISPSKQISKATVSASINPSKQISRAKIAPSFTASMQISRATISPSIIPSVQISRPTVVSSIPTLKQMSATVISPTVPPSRHSLSGFATVYSKPSPVASKLEVDHHQPHPPRP